MIELTPSKRPRRSALFFAVGAPLFGALAVQACSSSGPPPVDSSGNGGGSGDGSVVTPDAVAPGADVVTADVTALDAAKDGSAPVDATQPPPVDAPYDAPFWGFDVEGFVDATDETPPPCGFACSPGCCPTDGGACQPGTSDTVCGQQANACQDCTLTGQTCQGAVCQ